MIIKLKNKQITNIKKCFTDELGINNFISLEYSPKYICYIEDKPKTENSNNGKHVVILLEIPGTIDQFTHNLKLTDNNYKLRIGGIKKLSKKLNIKKENTIFSSIEEGNFSLDILIPHDEERNIILAKETAITSLSKTKDGYVKITCDLDEVKQELVLNNDDED